MIHKDSQGTGQLRLGENSTGLSFIGSRLIGWCEDGKLQIFENSKNKLLVQQVPEIQSLAQYS